MFRRVRDDDEADGLGLDVGGAACSCCWGLTRSAESAELGYEGVKLVFD